MLQRSSLSMFSDKGLSVLLFALLLLDGCGAGPMAAPTVTGVTVQTQPSNGTAYSGMAAPQNQVSFTAYYVYSDGNVGTTPIANVQWTGDGAYWVSLQGSVATCTQPSPIVILPVFSTVTASAQVNGTAFKGNSGLYCI